MDYSRRRKSRRSRRGGAVTALSPANISGGRRRSRRSRRGGSLGAGFALNPAPVGTLSAGADRNIQYDGIAGQGITNGGLMGTTLTAGGRRRRSRRSRRERR
jgi:hypothetical protein